MPKLYSSKTVISALQRDDFIVISQRGSHIKLHKKIRDKTFTVIVPNHKEIAIGTFNSILKQAGKTKQEFEKLVR